MSGYRKYFENGSKNMFFLIKDDEVWDKYDQIWDVVKNKLINFHGQPAYEYRYLKAKVKEFDGVIKTNFLGNNVSKENMHYTCISSITIDSFLRIDKKIIRKFIQKNADNITKTLQMSRFINTELKSHSDSESDSEVQSKSDAELMAKLKSDSDQQ